MASEWSNWSGSLRFTPGRVERPTHEEELARLVQRALDERRVVRVVGAGHSSSPLVETDDVLVSLERFQGLVAHDEARARATIRAGMTVKDTGKAVLDVRLALHNTGDVDVQTMVGAIATGTHGSGKTLKNLAAALVGARVVTGQGEIIDVDVGRQPELLRALRAGLGALGIIVEATLELLPAYELHRREWCTTTEPCLAHLDELIASNRNFDFYWYPRSDEVKLRTMNIPGDGPVDIPYARLVRDRRGWSNEILPRERELKFDEMEYSLPAESGPACFREVRQRVLAKHRRTVGWRVLYRTVAPDDAYLSPACGRDTVTISLHQNNTLPFQDYFNDIEPIFRAHGGRPHWGKKHHLFADELEPLYPHWGRFLEQRQALDPHGVFLSTYLRRLLISGLG